MVEVRRGGGGGGGGGGAGADIKSNNPHLAGGEQPQIQSQKVFGALGHIQLFGDPDYLNSGSIWAIYIYIFIYIYTYLYIYIYYMDYMETLGQISLIPMTIPSSSSLMITMIQAGSTDVSHKAFFVQIYPGRSPHRSHLIHMSSTHHL